jgi:hypothetical protein
MLDGDDLPAAASGDDEQDDLDKYLDELDDEGADGNEADVDVGEDISKYLKDLGVSEDDVDGGETGDAKETA